jgi:hypothetical protein
MVPDNDHGSGSGQMFPSLDDDEADAGGIAHDEVERAGHSPLGEAMLAEETEEERGEDAVAGAEEERQVGVEKAGQEARERVGGNEEGHDEEGHGEEDAEEEDEEGIVDD